jgi:hypothetical protein
MVVVRMHGPGLTFIDFCISFGSFSVDVGVALTLALILSGYQVKENKSKILTFAVFFGALGALLLLSPPFVRTVTNVLLSFAAIKVYLNFPFNRAFLVLFLFLSFNIVGQGTATLVWHYWLGISTADYFASPPLRLLYLLSCNVPLAVFACFAYRFKWRATAGIGSIKVPAAALPPAAQFILLLILINDFFFGSGPALENRAIKAFIFSLLAAATLLSSFCIWRFLREAEKEAAAVAQEKLAGEMRRWIDAVRAQRHDFINQVQIMVALLKDGRKDELTSFVETVRQSSGDRPPAVRQGGA